VRRAFPVALIWLACASQRSPDLPGIPAGTTSGGSPSSLPSGRTFDGGAGELRVTILVPPAMAALKGGTAPEVRAQVASVAPGTDQPSTDAVDPTSVTFALRTPGGTDKDPAASGRLFGPMPAGQFSGRLDLGKVPTGDYTLTVAAASQAGARGAASLPVRVDSGPRITVVSPREGGSYKGSLVAQVVIDSAPFEPTGAIEASVGTTPVTLTPSGAPNSYQAPVEFLKFNPPLVGEQAFRVAASNAAGTRTDVTVRFSIDTLGPALTDAEPKEGTVVGGVIRIRVKVADPAAVLGGSVIAVIGNKTDTIFKLDLRPESAAGVYSELFDTARLTRCRPLPDPSLCIVFPTLSFRAADTLGNEATLSYEIAVDNQPPVLDLDPPPDVRIIRYDTRLHRTICSWAFDPLGDYRRPGDMPGDGCAVPQVFDLRARIEDAGNRADGLKQAPTAGVDPLTTSLYVLDDTAQSLVVDVDGDGVCDAINPKLVPTTSPPLQSNQVLAVRLAAVPPHGRGDFTADPALIDPAVLAAYPGCSQGQDPESPRPLCGSTRVTVALGAPAATGPDSAIWALEPITSREPWCLGSQFDTYANQIGDGWVCVAAAATDRLGNASVSPPLRLWVQQRGLGQLGVVCPGPPPGAPPPPDCTGSFNRASGALSASPCQSRRFPPRQVINEGALPEGQ
jgi:hypothetical protein